MKTIIDKIKDFWNDPFFWCLLEAQRSPDSHALKDLFENYTAR